jgi:hypothetical protein
VFQDLRDALPLSVTEGAPVQPLTLETLNGLVEKYKQKYQTWQALQTGSGTSNWDASQQGCELIAGGNAMWVSLTNSVSSVPINRRGVKYLMDFLFQSPARMQFVVGVSEKVDSYQELQLLSPEEPHHAMILAVCRDIQGGKDQQVLMAWRNQLLTCLNLCSQTLQFILSLLHDPNN